MITLWSDSEAKTGEKNMITTTKRDKVDRTVENTKDDMTVLGSEAKPEVDSKHYTAAEFSSPFMLRTKNLGENFRFFFLIYMNQLSCFLVFFLNWWPSGNSLFSNEIFFLLLLKFKCRSKIIMVWGVRSTFSAILIPS